VRKQREKEVLSDIQQQIKQGYEIKKQLDRMARGEIVPRRVTSRMTTTFWDTSRSWTRCTANW
jgi:hypothetical protein